ncbi:MAG: hypothetical protein R3338_11790 [Thermoanaerobaculia bacterium]|nr:hypothetical protein [Thermoanaerobaculia bacterium]
MRIRYAIVSLLFPSLLFCGEPTPRGDLPHGPVSIRGWVARVEGVPNYGQDGNLYDLNAYVEGIERVSGGVQEDGAFIILGVPPGESTIVFQAPGVDDAAIHFQGLPPKADVLLPGIVLTPDGVSIPRPELAKVRIPNGRGTEVEQVESETTANSLELPTYLVPIRALGDRLNYPLVPARGNTISIAPPNASGEQLATPGD